ncbi:13035_t:CDS:2, partial [Acaulospora morrowiae]
FWEGRRLWSTMTIAIRNLTRTIWVSVKEDDSVDRIIEKKTVINLLVGFAVAVKHYLREEEGTDHEDLKGLISNIRSTLPGFEPLSEQGQKTDETPENHRPHHHKHYHLNHHHNLVVNHNLPLEITLHISAYIHSVDVNVPTKNTLIQNLNMLVDCLSNFERILRTPIPLAYSIHLNQVLYIYCLSLPFQLVSTTGWPTIPVVFLASFVLIGIERIGVEIENPFGYDENDLEVDDFCGIIKLEVSNITSRPPPKVQDWIYSSENHPFENEKNLNAIDARNKDLDEVRSILSQKTRNTSELTREDLNEDISIKVEDRNTDENVKN